MKHNLGRVLARLMIILLVCVLGSLLLAARADEANRTCDDPASLPGSSRALTTVQQACYTLDTSRAEWLAAGPGGAIYLPLLIKSYTP